MSYAGGYSSRVGLWPSLFSLDLFGEIKVQLKGNSQPLMVYSLDEIERLSDPPSASAHPTILPELPKVI